MKHYTERKLEQMHDDMLNECTPLVIIGALVYEPAEVLKNVDPIAYRQSFLDWLDSEVSSGNIFEQDNEYYDEQPEKE